MSTENEAEAPKKLKLSENPDIPILPGWVPLTEAAVRLGVTRQHSYKRAQNNGFKSLHRLAGSTITVVSTEELDEIIERRGNRPQKSSE